jgi:hypothetical protein
MKRKFLTLNEFAHRQFNDPQYTGTKIKLSMAEFMNKIDEIPRENLKLVDGYRFLYLFFDIIDRKIYDFFSQQLTLI